MGEGTKLNPNAAEFVPVRVRYAKGNTISSVLGRRQHTPFPRGVDYLTTLPDDVLAIILGQLTSPQDLVSVASACRRLRSVSAIVPLRLHLKRAGVEDLSRLGDGPRIHRVLRSICSTFAGIQELDLSGCLVEDEDIVGVVRKLPQLRMLQLSGCRKLTSGLMAAVKDTCAKGSHNLQAISLQRCYQQTGRTLTDAMAAATTLNLKCIILSHLHLSEWPSSFAPSTATQQLVQAYPVGGDPEDDSGDEDDSDTEYSGTEYEAYVTVDSQMEQLSLSMEEQQLSGPFPITAACSGRDVDTPLSCNLTSLRILALHNCVHLTSNGLEAFKNCCRNVEYIFFGGSTLRVLPSHRSPLHDQLSMLVAPELLTGDLPQSYVTQVATELAVFALDMPRLQAMELTFFKGGIPEVVNSMLQSHMPSVEKQHGSSISIWDFNSLYSLHNVLALMKSFSSIPTPARWDSLGPSFCMAVQSTANCSSASRHTPLHLAAAEGSLPIVQALLDVGAVVDMRDRGGNTPLFIAAEVGHVDVVKELLARGSDFLVKNNAGETTLYIASLKGHGAVVAAVLRHFQWNGVPWHCPQLYSEGWTPLMAAVVGSHQGVVRQLIRAAGSNTHDLVTAANRNKQTALHIAAQIGSIPILTILLEAGGVKVLSAKDNNGKTALHVAQNNHHCEAASLLADYMRRGTGGRQQMPPPHPIGPPRLRRHPPHRPHQMHRAMY